MNSTDYETNPILFWNHDYNLPVGRCVALTRQPDGIVGEFTLAQRPDGFEGSFFPDVVRALIGQGIVRGVSIGYAAEQGGTRRATVEDRKRYGDAVHTVFSKWKLLEISVAPLQCNPDALVSAVKKGAVTAADAARWFGYSEPQRHRVVVPIPARTWATVARGAAETPIDVKGITRREIMRARGLLR
jgi:HK97 family phage prohead protease